MIRGLTRLHAPAYTRVFLSDREIARLEDEGLSAIAIVVEVEE